MNISWTMLYLFLHMQPSRCIMISVWLAFAIFVATHTSRKNTCLLSLGMSDRGVSTREKGLLT